MIDVCDVPVISGVCDVAGDAAGALGVGPFRLARAGVKRKAAHDDVRLSASEVHVLSEGGTYDTWGWSTWRVAVSMRTDGSTPITDAAPTVAYRRQESPKPQPQVDHSESGKVWHECSDRGLLDGRVQTCVLIAKALIAREEVGSVVDVLTGHPTSISDRATTTEGLRRGADQVRSSRTSPIRAAAPPSTLP